MVPYTKTVYDLAIMFMAPYYIQFMNLMYFKKMYIQKKQLSIFYSSQFRVIQRS